MELKGHNVGFDLVAGNKGYFYKQAVYLSFG